MAQATSFSQNFTPLGKPGGNVSERCNEQQKNHGKQRLPITPKLGERETIMSYVSKIALENGAPSSLELCNDFRLHWKGICGGKDADLANISALSGVPIAILRHASPVLTETRQFLIANQLISFKALNKLVTRVCPRCLIEDGESGRPIGRVEWLVPSFRSCPKHNAPLVALPGAVRPRCDFDFQFRVQDHWSEIEMHAQSHVTTGASNNLEAYIQDRFSGHLGRRWIDQIELGVVIDVAQKLGIVLVYGQTARHDGLSMEELSNAAETGFNVLSRGRKALQSALQQIRQKSTCLKPGFYTDFGHFARWITRVDYQHDRYASVVAEITDFAFSTYPYGRGEILLARVCPRRKIHSLASAAQKHGLKLTRANRLARVVVAPHAKPNAKVTFEADRYDPIFEEFAQCVSGRALAKALGIGTSVIFRLTAAKLIQPRFKFDTMAPVYHPNDIAEFLGKFRQHARHLTTIPPGFCTLNVASNRAKVNFEGVLELAISGKIRSLTHSEKHPKLWEFYADYEEILDLLEGEPIAGFTSSQVQRFLRINSSTMSVLLREGTLSSDLVKHHRTRKTMSLLQTHDVVDFLERFATLGMMANQVGTQAIHVVRKLEMVSVLPLDIGSPSLSKIFNRVDIEQAGFGNAYLEKWTALKVEEALS